MVAVVLAPCVNVRSLKDTAKGPLGKSFLKAFSKKTGMASTGFTDTYAFIPHGEEWYVDPEGKTATKIKTHPKYKESLWEHTKDAWDWFWD